ncbi:hypothetical protein FF1_025244 [Malus domestica]
MVPEGHVPVYVGKEMEQFMVSTKLLNHPVFVELLNKSALSIRQDRDLYLSKASSSAASSSTMSNERKNPYQYDHFDYNHHKINNSSFPFFNYGNSSIYQNQPDDPQTLNGFESDHPNPFMSFTDCLHGSLDYNTLLKAFDMSCSSSEVIFLPLDHDNNSNKQPAAAGVRDHSVGTTSTTKNPSTPNYSPISSSSNEAAGAAGDDQVLDEDLDYKRKKDKQPKLGSDGDHEDKSKKSFSSLSL